MIKVPNPPVIAIFNLLRLTRALGRRPIGARLSFSVMALQARQHWASLPSLRQPSPQRASVPNSSVLGHATARARRSSRRGRASSSGAFGVSCFIQTPALPVQFVALQSGNTRVHLQPDELAAKRLCCFGCRAAAAERVEHQVARVAPTFTNGRGPVLRVGPLGARGSPALCCR